MKPELTAQEQTTASGQQNAGGQDPNQAAADAYRQAPAAAAAASRTAQDCETGQCVAEEEDPMKPETFTAPLRGPLPDPTIVIEFCDRCRWLHRATWVQTELFLTFQKPHDDSQSVAPSKASGGAHIEGIMLLPQTAKQTAGRFRVWLYRNSAAPTLLWDRKVKGAFPELKELKQIVRDHVAPGQSLGHSDKHAKPPPSKDVS
ncbi:hypothetical protein FA10DRAFT_229048 [Acaromyces ingoldii]|uniref:Rdx family-domain-containing protein n=1 Tax=Acaromyces ingoldii TaxID=215250 RepID=A0A316YWG8_9BASI|nr:hypothetical protein FA10DRAFT_229048 [Acaromyces ingoldii]PWN92135.1 hypothetical protein FA10DRAFT_229048 [Acaromyces ingoldii]